MTRLPKPIAAALFVVGMLATACSGARAQNAPPKWADTVSREIDRAYFTGDLAKVQAARALAERVASAFPGDGLILHYHAFALCREGNLIVGRGGDGSPMFGKAQDILERSLKLRPLAETHALLSSVDGQLIAKDPSRAMELGMAAGASMGAAFALGPSNPRVALIQGQGALYTPSEYGGGLDVAERHLKRAIELYANDAPKPGEPSWGKAEAHLWLGQVYERMHDKARAAAEYKAALEIEPDFMWAKSLAEAVAK